MAHSYLRLNYPSQLSDDDTAPATWRPGGPVVEAKTAPPKKYIYKDASDQDFTDDGEIDDAADSDFDVGVKAPPKKRSPKKTPSKKSPVKNGKKKTPVKKTPAKKGKKAATNGTTPRYLCNFLEYVLVREEVRKKRKKSGLLPKKNRLFFTKCAGQVVEPMPKKHTSKMTRMTLRKIPMTLRTRCP